MLEEFRTDYPVVNEHGAIVLHGSKTPDEKDALKQKEKKKVIYCCYCKTGTVNKHSLSRFKKNCEQCEQTSNNFTRKYVSDPNTI